MSKYGISSSKIIDSIDALCFDGAITNAFRSAPAVNSGGGKHSTCIEYTVVCSNFKADVYIDDKSQDRRCTLSVSH
jgi:hypothetical protein